MPQTEEQRKNTLFAAGYDPNTFTPGSLPSISPTITSSDLSASDNSVVVPPTPTPTDPRPSIDSSLDSIISSLGTRPAEETASTDFQNKILESLETLGTRRARQRELESKAGLDTQRQQLNDIVGQLQTLQKEAAAIPLQIQEEFAGRGVTEAGVRPIETGRLRTNAIKALSLSAIGQTLQGNIGLAEASIAKALDVEFEPEETKLKILEQLYNFNKDALERTDKKRADALSFAISERNRILESEKANKEEIYKIGTLAGKYGASTIDVQKILSAKTREEATILASKYLQDPIAKVELRNAELDNILKQSQIEKVQKETSLLGEPSDAEKKAEREALKKAESAIPLLQGKVDMIDAIKESPGLRGSVGVYGIARWTPLDPDKKDRQNFIGSVEQLRSREFVDAILDMKAQGGTLGALNEQEGEQLRNAATKISFWALKENGKVYGYEIDEDSFKRELDIIKERAGIALSRARGSIFSEEEQEILNTVFSNDSAFNPASFY